MKVYLKRRSSATYRPRLRLVAGIPGYRRLAIRPLVDYQRPQAVGRYIDESNCCIRFGHFRGRHIDDVPPRYLMWVLTSSKELNSRERHVVAYHLHRHHGLPYELDGGLSDPSSYQAHVVKFQAEALGKVSCTEGSIR